MTASTAGLFLQAPAPIADAGPVSLIFQRNVEIPVRDGTVLRGNLYRPVDGAPAPVLMTFGPYGKDVPLAVKDVKHFQALGGGVFLNWETPDPEHWVPRGYAVLRVDSRGSGASPGHLDPLSATQADDFFDAIEWAGTQPWSTGKVGLLGISYYAVSQWAVAARRPPHLTAMMPWEGSADSYRDFLRHGGILIADFIRMWSGQNLRNQHRISDDEPGNGVDTYDKAKAHPLDDASYREWVPDLADITAPLVSVGNWGNLLLHLRGNTEGYTQAGSAEKWLRIVEGDHFLPFYSPDALALQESFFGHYLKGDDTGWEQQPPVRIAIRAADGSRWRDADSWPLPNTAWTDLYLDASTSVLGHGTPTDEATVDYDAPEGKVTFTWPPAAQETEITGPVALRLWVSSTTSDMDVYVTLRQRTAAGDERFSIGPAGQPGPLAQGWLRVSHRALDAARSLPYRPFHSHDREELLGVGDVVPIDIEVWPTSIVLAAGDILLLDLSSSDQDVPFRMDTDPDERPAERFDGVNTIHTGPDHPSFLRLPIIAGDHS